MARIILLTYKVAKLAIASGWVSNFTNAPFRADFSQSQRNVLLRMAIDTDDIEIFNTVLEHVVDNDPNYDLIENSNGGPGSSWSHSEASLLYTAIENKKPNVALSLAENPKTDIRNSGYSSRSRPTDNELSDHKSCLVMARKNEMTEVVSVLAEREAVLLQTQAERLQKEAKLIVG